MAFLCLLHRLDSLLFHFVSLFTSSFFLNWTSLHFSLFAVHFVCGSTRHTNRHNVWCMLLFSSFTFHSARAHSIFSYTTHAYIHTQTHTHTYVQGERDRYRQYMCVMIRTRAFIFATWLWIVLCDDLVSVCATYRSDCYLLFFCCRSREPTDRPSSYSRNQPKAKPHRANRTTKLFDTLNTNTCVRTRSTSTLF